MVRDWLLNDDALQKFQKATGDAKKRLMDTLAEVGTVDEKGSQWIHFPDDPVEGRIKSIKRQRSVIRSLRDPQDIEKFLRKKGLWDQCTRTEVVIDEDAILGAAFGPNAAITEAELRKYVYEYHDQWSFIPGRIKL